MGEFSVFAGQPDQLFKQVAAHYDAPAFARRARRVEEAYAELVERCQAQREEWLDVVRGRLSSLGTLGGVDDVLELAASLNMALPASATMVNRRKWRRARAELAASITRFNHRWTRYLEAIDLASLNRLREDYNRYYLLEKECALRSARLARIGFVPLRPITIRDLANQFPILPMPTHG